MLEKILIRFSVILIICSISIRGEQTTVKIGALFDTNIDENKQMFQYAIEKVNENMLSEEEFILEGQVADVVYGNDITVSRGLCGLLEQEMAAIFGPEDISSAIHASNICDTKDIPYIDTRFDAFSSMPVVNMYPAAASLSKMVTDLVLAAEWKSFTILYEKPDFLPRVADLLQMYDSKGYTITVRRIEYGLIHELSLMLGFKYQFQLQEDGVYGSRNNVTGEWNGMIRALQDGKADLAITDLTITSERESGADFTMPFMNLGIQVLYQTPSKQPPSTFSFLSPFSGSVWISLGIAYFTVSICLFVLGRLSPSEWDNPFPCCVPDPTELENQFTFANSMWFCIGALLQQGSEIAPKAPSTRIVAAIWWFFTLIMVSSYTANLAAFLTIETPFERIKSVEDLKDCGNPGGQCPVTFGAKKGGATFNFFKDSDHPTYKSMYRYMVDHPEYMTTSNYQGVEWATKNNYAFLMESSSIEYIIERNCEVTQIGGLLDDKGYGIAMRQNSEYRNVLSEGVLRLQESGKLSTLKIKWWKEKKGGGACSGESEEGALALEMANVEGVFYVLAVGVFVALIFAFIAIVFEVRRVCEDNEEDNAGDAQSLNMENVNSVFIVLFGGCLFAIFAGYIECCVLCYQNAKKAKLPFKEEFIAEMKFILKFEGNTKLVRHHKSESEDSHRSTPSFHSNQSEMEPTGKSVKSRHDK